MEQQLQEGFYRFRPTDSERLKLLLRYIAKQEMNDSGFITTNIDVYGGEEPWEIYNHGVPCGNDDDNADSSNYRYFITKLKKKSKAGYNREVGNKGSWKQQDKAKSVHYENVGNSSLVVIGCKKSLCYVNKEYYNQNDGHWLMKEYELSSVILQKFDEDRRDYVLCAIKRMPHSTDYARCLN
uniref:NAC domain-containing protein 78-like n=1 Tax=Nicotiana sylvestris TaxID=4096 RepID=A0A1U7VJP9_NICSY|nr:PREDICTED: NAC domain-containing protein 78-like [Nicotiana sylvestris]